MATTTVPLTKCLHTHHLFAHPLCKHQSRVRRIMNIALNVFTLGIPLLTYRIYKFFSHKLCARHKKSTPPIKIPPPSTYRAQEESKVLMTKTNTPPIKIPPPSTYQANEESKVLMTKTKSPVYESAENQMMEEIHSLVMERNKEFLKTVFPSNFLEFTARFKSSGAALEWLKNYQTECAKSVALEITQIWNNHRTKLRESEGIDLGDEIIQAYLNKAATTVGPTFKIIAEFLREGR